MFETHLTRYLTYSSLLHIVVFGWFILFSFSKKSSKIYYAVDFLGGGGGSVSGSETQAEVKKAQEKETIKTKIVNPQEDLLLKSKQKLSKNEKEIITTAPPLPVAPIPQAPIRSQGALASAIPSLDSGVGIGFGDGTGGGGGGAGNFPYTWYVQSMKKKLDSNWNVTTGFQTKIYTQVAFTIRKDGTLIDIEVEESSRNEVFDRAAVRAVEYANPFPPLPSDFQESELRVHVRFTVKR